MVQGSLVIVSWFLVPRPEKGELSIEDFKFSVAKRIRDVDGALRCL